MRDFEFSKPRPYIRNDEIFDEQVVPQVDYVKDEGFDIEQEQEQFPDEKENEFSHNRNDRIRNRTKRLDERSRNKIKKIKKSIDVVNATVESGSFTISQIRSDINKINSDIQKVKRAYARINKLEQQSQVREDVSHELVLKGGVLELTAENDIKDTFLTSLESTPYQYYNSWENSAGEKVNISKLDSGTQVIQSELEFSVTPVDSKSSINNGSLVGSENLSIDGIKDPTTLESNITLSGEEKFNKTYLNPVPFLPGSKLQEIASPDSLAGTSLVVGDDSIMGNYKTYYKVKLICFAKLDIVDVVTKGKRGNVKKSEIKKNPDKR